VELAFPSVVWYFGHVQAKIRKIGDQFGLMLPPEVVQACGLGSEATVTVENKKLVVTASESQPREGWAEAMQAISQEELDEDYSELQSFRETPHE